MSPFSQPESHDFEAYVVAPEDSCRVAVAKMLQNKSRTVFAVDRGKVVGSLTEGDVLKSILRGAELDTLVKKVLNPSFVYLDTHDRQRALILMRSTGAVAVPVVNSLMEMLGVITLGSVLDLLDNESQ